VAVSCTLDAVNSFRRVFCCRSLTVYETVYESVKQIVAIVKPYLAEKVLESLKRAPLEAVSVCEVKGYGRQKSYLDQYGDSEYSLAFLPKVELILWVEDSRAEEILRKVVEVARTGRMGDGKIFVLPATQVKAVDF
jgi:nitrogen regulatory protein PII